MFAQHVRPAEDLLSLVERLSKRVGQAAALVNLGDVLLTEPDLVECAPAEGDLLPRVEEFLHRRP